MRNLLMCLALAGCAATDSLPLTVATTTTSTTTTTTTTTTTVAPDPPRLPSTTTSLPRRMTNCPEWEATALEAGWPVEHLERLDYIVWRESRCLPYVHNVDDPAGGSRGLSQLNGFWCRPSQYFPDGWLQTQGVVESCDDLFDPATNLVAARAIFEYADERGCGWSPWTTRNTRWC